MPAVLCLSRRILLLAALATIVISAPAQDNDTASEQKRPPLSMVETPPPAAVLHASYYAQLKTTGGTPPVRWTIVRGTLPAGLELDVESGEITGVPTQEGEFPFIAEVSDTSKPPETIQREFSIRVSPALAVRWKTPAIVNGNTISGSVEVANATSDDFDMTVIVVAVNEYGKAFALGYQHFTLNRETTGLQIDFGSTLPQGSYVVHVDAVAEVPKRDAIFRARLQTPSALAVTVGP